MGMKEACGDKNSGRARALPAGATCFRISNRPRFFSSARAFLFGCFFFASLLRVLGAENWESTVPPLTPGPFAEIRPARAQYNFAWHGLTAATAELHLTKTADGHFRLEASGGTTGLARALWKFDVKNTSTSDARTFRPIEAREVETGSGKTLDTDVSFAPDKVTSRREERIGSSVKSKTRTFDFPDVLSLNSAMLYLRAKPLQLGAVQRIVVYPATSGYLCTVTVVGRERITVPTGAYDAIKVDLQLDKIGKMRELLPHKKFKRASVWLTNDADHMILRIEAQVFIGTVVAELQSIQFDEPKP